MLDMKAQILQQTQPRIMQDLKELLIKQKEYLILFIIKELYESADSKMKVS